MTSGHLTTTWDITPGAPVLVPAIPVTFGVHMGWHIGPNLWCCVWGGIQEARQRRILVLLCPCTTLQSLMWGIPQQSPLFRLMTSCEADLSWENPPMPVPLYPFFPLCCAETLALPRLLWQAELPGASALLLVFPP